MSRRDASQRAVGPGDLVRRLQEILPGSRRRLTRLALVSFVGGTLEAGLLVLLARVAVAAAEGAGAVGLTPGDGLTVSVSVALVAALGLLVAKLAVGIYVARATATMAVMALTEVRLGLLRSYLRAGWSVQAAERPGHLQELMTTYADRTTNLCLSLAMFVTTGLNMATLVVIAVVVDPVAAAAIVVTGGALAAAMRPLAGAGRRISYRQADAGRTFAGKVAELVATTRELRVFGVESAALAKVEDLHQGQARQYRRSRSLLLLAPQLYQSAALLVLIAGIGLITLTGTASLAGIGAVVLLLLRAFNYGQQFQSAYQVLNDVTPYLDQVRQQRDVYLAGPATRGRRPVEHIGRLRFDAVGFEYRSGQRVLHDVSVTFEAGEAVGIIGPSGSGKSTLLQVLLRLREPTVGRLLIDEVDARELDLHGWHARAAFVTQDPRLIEGTVGENIAFFRDIPRERIREAAAMAHLSEEIAALPRGFDEMIGPEDTTLSGGQQQRLTIARALAGHPDLLVLDEPTSALDLLSEARIQETLRAIRGRMTLVVVAHRLSTIAECDRVLVLGDGVVQGFDRHEALLSRSGFYEETLRLSMLSPS